jgi:hypothetical protein
MSSQPNFYHFNLPVSLSPGTVSTGRFGFQRIIPLDSQAGQPAVLNEKIVKPLAFESLRFRVSSFASLRPGWDSYLALAPSMLAVRTARQFLGKLEIEDLLPNAVIPTSDESILIRYVRSGVTYRWEFYSDGEIAYSKERDGGAREYFDVASNDIGAPLSEF